MSKANISTIIAGLLLIIGLAATAGGMKPENVYEAGVVAFEADNFEETFRLLEEAIEKGLSGRQLKDACLKLYVTAAILNNLQKIEYYESKCRALMPHFKAINTQAFSDLTETALFLARSNKSATGRAEALKDLALELSKAGMAKEAGLVFSEVLDSVRSFENRKGYYADSLIDISVALARTGWTDQALHTARSISHLTRKADALRGIAVELVKSGHTEQADMIFTEAIDVVRSTEDSAAEVFAKASTQCDIAIDLSRAGKTGKADLVFSEALETLKKWGGWSERWEGMFKEEYETKAVCSNRASSRTAELPGLIEDTGAKSDTLSRRASELEKAGKQQACSSQTG